MSLLGLRDSAVASAAAALDEMDLDEEIGMLNGVLPAEELAVSVELEDW